MAKIEDLQASLKKLEDDERRFRELDTKREIVEKAINNLDDRLKEKQSDLKKALDANAKVKALSHEVRKLPLMEEYAHALTNKKNRELEKERLQETLNRIDKLNETLQSNKESFDQYIEKSDLLRGKRGERRNYEGAGAILERARKQLKNSEKDETRKSQDLTKELENCSEVLREKISIENLENLNSIIMKKRGEIQNIKSESERKLEEYNQRLGSLKERIKDLEYKIVKISEAEICPICGRELTPDHIGKLQDEFATEKRKIYDEITLSEEEQTKANQRKEGTEEELEKRASINSAKIKKLAEQIAEITERISQERLEVEELEKRAETLRKLDEEIKNLEGDLDKIEEAYKTYESAKREIAKYPPKNEIETKLRPIIDELNEIFSTLRTLEENLGYTPEDAEKELKELRNKKEEYDRNLPIAESKGVLESEILTISQEVSNKKLEQSIIIKEIKKLAYDEKVHRKKEEDLKTEVQHKSELDKEIVEITTRIKNINDELLKLKEELDHLQQKEEEKIRIENFVKVLDKIIIPSITLPTSLGEAVDNTELNWTTGGDAEWVGQTNICYYDNDAAQSGNITDNMETWMKTSVSGSCTLSFYWMVDSEEGYDFLRFYVDDVELDMISGSTSWTQKLHSIGSGSHILAWKYTKDYSASVGEDCGWLDKVEILEVIPPRNVSQAIEDGVAWLARQQNSDGSWGTSNKIAETAFAVKKLEHHALDSRYGYGLDSPFNLTYPYAGNVSGGLNYIFTNALIIDIGTQTHDGSVHNPDANHNGKGVYFGSPEIYQTAIALMTIVESTTPDRIVNIPNATVNGWTYKQVAQDIVDFLAWAQTDSGYGRGGWDYEAMNNAGERSDNSNTGYAVLGLLYAQSKLPYGFEIPIPQFVKDELKIWINYIQCKVAGTNYGGSGYSGPNEWVNTLKTGNLLLEMAFVGDTNDTQRVKDAIDYIVRHWNDTNDDPGWKGQADPLNPPFSTRASYQAIYCIMKGFEVLKIVRIDGIDWQDDFASVLLAQQNPDGSWQTCTWGDQILATEWALLSLQKIAPPPPPPLPRCIPCVSIKVNVEINNKKFKPDDIFRFKISVLNNQTWKTGKSRMAITYGIIDPTPKAIIIGTCMPDIYVNDTYSFSADFLVPRNIFSGDYVFFALAVDMETGCRGIDAELFSIELASATSKEESWNNWLKTIEVGT